MELGVLWPLRSNISSSWKWYEFEMFHFILYWSSWTKAPQKLKKPNGTMTNMKWPMFHGPRDYTWSSYINVAYLNMILEDCDTSNLTTLDLFYFCKIKKITNYKKPQKLTIWSWSYHLNQNLITLFYTKVEGMWPHKIQFQFSMEQLWMDQKIPHNFMVLIMAIWSLWWDTD